MILTTDRARRKIRILIMVVILSAVGLWIHAKSYGFFADDAFITLRYGRTLWEHGEPVYNLGERVEGYTSPMWMLLAACAHAAGNPVAVMQVVGGLCAVAWLVGIARVWMLVEPRAVGGGVGVVFATAMSCPVAAWTMGGLETPLFGALMTWSIAAACRLVDSRNRQRCFRQAIVLATLLCLTTFARPEGAMVAAVLLAVLLAVLWSLRFDHVRWRAPVFVGGLYALGTGAHVLWRYWYYGYPFPNTYYLKSSGDAAQLVERGTQYVLFASKELGWPLIALVALGVIVPVSRSRQDAQNAAEATDAALATQRMVLWSSKALVLLFIPYVIRVGGDFLDLYRFFAPILPLAFLLVAVAIQRAMRRFRVPWQATLLLGAVLLSMHGYNQWTLRSRALQVSEKARAERGIEPLGWTKLYALRWAAMGRWVASMAEPHEWMAVGAAGAMPYYARISNLDTFGLCDEFVAHQGAIAGSRPGHQRFASTEYIVSRKPMFIFVGDYSRDKPMATLSSHSPFQKYGYRLVEAQITSEVHGAPEEFFHYLYAREGKATELHGRAYFRGR